MQVGGITEIIAHFVGELRIALENERVDVVLDGGLSRVMQPDVFKPFPDLPPPRDAGPLPDARSALRPDVALAETEAFDIRTGLASLAAAKAMAAPVAPALAVPKDIFPNTSSGFYTTSYIRFEDGDLTPTQSHVHVVQDNALDDRDVFGPIVQGLELASEPGQLECLVLMARAAGPDGSGIIDLQHHEMIQAVARLQHVPAHDSSGVVSLSPGTTIDGAVVSDAVTTSGPLGISFENPFEGWNGIDQRPREEPLPDGEQSVHAGSNAAANVAVLVDATGQTASMIVAGDVHRTNTIVQVNVLHDDDRVVVNGAGTVQSSAGGSHAGNIAHFDDVPVYKSIAGTTGFSSQWTTTVFNGDFYAVQSLIQRNWMIDDDIIVRQEGSEAFSLVTGHNVGVNNAAFIVSGMSFDMIVVGGSLYSANTIYQHNVVLDDDRIVLSSPDGSGSWTIATGANTLTNEAWIRDIGSGSFNPMTTAAKAVADSVLSGEGQVEVGKLAGLAAPGGASLDILVVTGNYYDIRIVSQMNVIGDADTVASLAFSLDMAGDDEDTGPVTQSIQSGGNSATNVAAIVNVGALTDTQYAGGEIYEDATLIQTNIVTSDASTLYQAFDALAPEVVAFIEHDPFGHGFGAGQDALAEATLLHPVTQNPDVLGSIMT